MGVPKTPRKGAKSAPSSAPAPAPATPRGSVKSAPSNAPSVRDTKPPTKNGDPYTPSSVKSAIVDPIAPKSGKKDPNIGRTV